MTQTCARPPQIVRRKFCPTQLGRQTRSQRTNHLLVNTFTPHGADLADATEIGRWSPDRRWSGNRERSRPNVHRVYIR
jgi:hypothetical protein